MSTVLWEPYIKGMN